MSELTYDEFYRHHRGGSGAVVEVSVFRNGREIDKGIFSSIDLAMVWRSSKYPSVLDSAVFSPYIVDDPDWGNERDA